MLYFLKDTGGMFIAVVYRGSVYLETGMGVANFNKETNEPNSVTSVCLFRSLFRLSDRPN